eukprot:TRINITY_DN6909_c0_g2_i1.p1 TRINITY_DN6909_c0_g2~~TRINITY_DN6909_c0_g2_i1.p1  ORF type:complete len:506 (-),score=203.16 TRINITY_DN6909_c0_g2_i1:1052-2569(-)
MTTAEPQKTEAAPAAAPAPAPAAAHAAIAKKKEWNLKTPKGTRDFGPLAMATRQKVLRIVADVYEKHAAVQIETPTFELSEILKGKYGEEGQDLIYNLQRGETGEDISLRYDLTVPFSRYLAQNKVKQIKRYQIGRVYRRDHVNIKQGRYREFYQCDFDYAGVADPMVPDSECVCILTDLLTALELSPFVIKVNNRQLLDAYLLQAGVAQENIRTACSSIDKLDKVKWSVIRNELVNEKKVASDAAADIIEKFIALKGKPAEVLAAAESLLTNTELAAKGISDMKLLIRYVEAFGCLDNVAFDLSLARGLDYYTGVIYEAVLTGSSLGSIAGGGRYDNLVGLFSGEKVPSVGFSLGIERVFNILEERAKKNPLPCADVVVLSAGGEHTADCMRICKRLWDAGVKTEMQYHARKLNPALVSAVKAGVQVAVIIGESELAEHKVQVKNLSAKASVTVPEIDVVATVKPLLCGQPSSSNTTQTDSAASANNQTQTDIAAQANNTTQTI